MTLAERDERIREALCEDSTIDLAEQLALVGRMALREGRDTVGDAVGAASLAERLLCEACLHEFDEDGFCEMCGRLREVTR